ncbi:STAS domain-containing protein [Ornithinimicrobium cavernae]|uniref:STAS domain-containing protein n=1 Tax=Ornithinimicrobium cavernae TaxID=2666047 RepID=UPI000D69C4FE|nr:STAS domain-containing protein [Ornithinimicrobium cavernae]
MQITDSAHGEVTVLQCEGRLTMTTARPFREAIEARITGGTTRLVLDLSATEFIDSSGLGALIAGLKRARQAGGDLRIAGAGTQVLTVLNLTNLDRVLRPHDSVEEACDGW